MNTHSYLIWRLAFSRSGGLVRKERQAWEVTKPAGWVPSESALAANLVHKERQVTKGAARVGSVSGPPVPQWRSVVGIVWLGIGVRVGEAAAGISARRGRRAPASA